MFYLILFSDCATVFLDYTGNTKTDGKRGSEQTNINIEGNIISVFRGGGHKHYLLPLRRTVQKNEYEKGFLHMKMTYLANLIR